MVPAFNPSTQEAKAGRFLRVQGQPGQQSSRTAADKAAQRNPAKQGKIYVL